MKKLIKLIGLLLIAGAMMTACKGGPGNDEASATIETKEIKFSNGNWEMKQKIDCTSNVASLKLDQNYSYSISGDNVSLTAGNFSMTQVMNFPASASDDDIATFKSNMETISVIMTMAGSQSSVTSSGRSVTWKLSGTLDENDIESENLTTSSVNDLLADVPSGTKIYTNEKNTVYKIIWSGEYDGEYADYMAGAGDFTGSFSMVFIKK